MNEKLYTYGPEEAKEMASHFKTTEKGSFVTKYIDMPEAIAIMRKWREKKGLGNKVEISLKQDVKLRKTGTYQKVFRNIVCPYTHILFGKFRGINPGTGIAQWSTLELDEFKAFNLDDDNDAADWIILRMAPCIEESCNSHKFYDTKFWEFNDIRANNSNTIARARNIVKVTKIVEDLSGSDMLNMARLLGFTSIPGDENSVTIQDIQGFILEMSLTDPDAFLSKYRDSNRAMHELILAAQAVGSILHSHVDGYSAMGNLIGRTLDEVTQTIRTDKNLYSMLKTQVVGSDILAKRMEDLKPEKVNREDILDESLKDEFAEPAENISLV
jgi:hypothetical protein